MRIPFAIPDAAGRAFDVVGLGQNSVDYVAVASTFPEPNSKQQLQQFAILPGGQIATATAACSKLGWRARYVGSFGDDELGRLSRDSLIREGVDVSASRVVPGAANRLAVVLVDAQTGERTVLSHRDPRLVLETVPGMAVISGRILLVDSEDILASTAAAAAARDAGILTIVDVEDVQPATDALLRHIDAIIAAEAFPSAFTGHGELGRALEALEREYRSPLVCVTLGAQGSLARCQGREIRTPAFTVACRDNTGAGDVFRGGFASGCLRWPEDNLERILAYANAAAALSCRAVGARGGLPTDVETSDLLKL